MKTTMSPSAKPAYRQLPVELTKTERSARAMSAAETWSRYCAIEAEKKETSSSFGRQLKDLRKEFEELQRAVRSGTETQSVQVETRRNEERRTVETIRLDTGEIIDTRPMTVEERQGKLFGIDGGKTTPSKPGKTPAEADQADRGDAKADAKSKADAKGEIASKAGGEKKPRARRADKKTTTPSAS